jgi:hypothetical protein
VRESIQRETGRSVEDWAIIARDCPETKHRARLKWMKDTYGLGQNRASVILDAAFPARIGWSDPATLGETLWADPQSRAIRDAVEVAATSLGEVLVTQRKSYTAFSRAVQFAAVRPDKNGTARLGLAIMPDTDQRLAPAKRESWSERLKSYLILDDPAAVDTGITALLRQAWTNAT